MRRSISIYYPEQSRQLSLGQDMWYARRLGVGARLNAPGYAQMNSLFHRHDFTQVVYRHRAGSVETQQRDGTAEGRLVALCEGLSGFFQHEGDWGYPQGLLPFWG